MQLPSSKAVGSGYMWQAAVRSGPVAGVVLAAGAASRMGAPKAMLNAGGRTFVARLVDSLAVGGCEPVVVVGASPHGGLADAVAGGPGHLVVNPGGGGGQIGSLRVALSQLASADERPEAVVSTPVDNPLVAPATVRALVEAWRRSRKAIVVPSYEGRRGHPVLFDMAVAPELLSPGLREGARSVVRRDPGRVLDVELDDPAVVDDLDTPAEYLARVVRAPR